MKKLVYLSAAVMMLYMTSCEEAIDLQPNAEVSIENYFNTADDLKLFSNYFYENTLANHETYDDQADDIIAVPLAARVQAGTSRTVPNSGGGWSWGVLRRMNTLLEYINKCPDKEAVQKYTAVAKFFRAYFYFEKVKKFGDVPWIDRQIGSADAQLYAPRDSREYIMQKMLEDIDYAIEYLPVKEKEASAPYRVTAGAALALKSNFCLFEGTFRKYHGIDLTAGGTAYNGETFEGHDWRFYLTQCVDACEKLMSGKYGSYKLYSTGKPAEDYLTLFGKEDADNTEFILAVKYDQGLSLKHNANSFGLSSTQGRPGYTRHFVCTYLMKDGTKFTDRPGWQTMAFADEIKDRDPRLQQSIRAENYHRLGETTILAPTLGTTVTGYQPVKFMGVSKIDKYNCDSNTSSSNDLPELRYAEVLLNLAEAKAELETLHQTDIEKTINELRKRVGMTGMLDMAAANANPDAYMASATTGYPNVEGSNKGVILEIRRERGVEMVQEGRRWWDLMRWKAGHMIDLSFQGAYFPGPGSYDLNNDGKADVILYADGTVAPKAENGETVMCIGKDIYLTDGNSGYYDGTHDRMRSTFNQDRDYYYPIPSDELSLNPNLKQNPNWL